MAQASLTEIAKLIGEHTCKHKYFHSIRFTASNMIVYLRHEYTGYKGGCSFTFEQLDEDPNHLVWIERTLASTYKLIEQDKKS